MPRVVATAVGLLLLFGMNPRAAQPEPVAKATSVVWLDCTFGPVPGRERVHLLLMLIGERVERGIVEPLGTLAADVSGLKLAA